MTTFITYCPESTNYGKKAGMVSERILFPVLYAAGGAEKALGDTPKADRE